MPSAFAHVAIPLALGLGLGSQVISRRLLVAGIVASVLPDLDVLTFRLGIAYSDAFGHRGASHSLAFALGLALVALACAAPLHSSRRNAFLFVLVCTASHGLLDMLTNGGMGVALWWPWSSERVFAPWRVIEVSPLGFHRMASIRGFEVIRSELLWVWLPSMGVGVALVVLRKMLSR